MPGDRAGNRRAFTQALAARYPHPDQAGEPWWPAARDSARRAAEAGPHLETLRKAIGRKVALGGVDWEIQDNGLFGREGGLLWSRLKPEVLAELAAQVRGN